MARHSLPKPRLRKGGKTYEIRTRVEGKIVTRSLGTRDYNEALRSVPGVWAELEGLSSNQRHEPRATPSQAPSLPILTIEHVCSLYRDMEIESERCYRKEYASGGINDPVQLARTYRARLERMLESAVARAVVYDFANEKWLLTNLSMSGKGVVRDEESALQAMARTRVQTIRQMIADDEKLEPLALQTVSSSPVKDASVPLLSEVSKKYIQERGAAMSKAVAADLPERRNAA